MRRWQRKDLLVIVLGPFALISDGASSVAPAAAGEHIAEVHRAVAHDRSAPLFARSSATSGSHASRVASPVTARRALRVAPSGGAEQTVPGDRAPARIVASFDGLGAGFVGPQGTANFRNPSDNSLAVGPDHVAQIVNSRMAVFTKKGARYDTTGRVLYGPVETRNVFRNFGDPCEQRNNGDAVVRYDQLANRC